MPLWEQIVWLVVLPLPIAVIAWTVTHEEVFRELRDYCVARSQDCRRLYQRKLFYIFTCEYCFSHWVTLAAVIFTGYQLLIPDWRGYIIAFFALVGMANAYMSLYGRLRVDIRAERAEAEKTEAETEAVSKPPPDEER